MLRLFSKRDRVGLTGQVIPVGRPSGQQLEDGVRAEGVVVVLVLVAGHDAVDAGPDHFQKGVLGEVGVAGIVEGLSKRPGQADALVELADGQQHGVAGEPTLRRLDDERRTEEVQDLWPGGCYAHRLAPRLWKEAAVSTG
jgi:hypothetical protein